jgi:periplasmic protein TonB
MMILLALLASATQPVPLKPIDKLLTDADKRAVVDKVGAQGTVGVKVTVDTTGRVSDCSVAHSSGFKVLDAETCNVVRHKARFSPARDEQGRAVPGVLYGDISWEPEVEKAE